MRAIGFRRAVAGGIEAAASSGGALVPPIMGAGAYMMLEIVTPAVTYLEIITAALVPAILYYAALLLIVHFHAKRIGVSATEQTLAKRPPKCAASFSSSLSAPSSRSSFWDTRPFAPSASP